MNNTSDMFKNRDEAGKKLAKALQAYKEDKNSLILGLPRGGIVVAASAAKLLKLPLDLTCPRKIGFPSYLEFAIGAITETGQSILNDEIINKFKISQEYLNEILKKEKQKAQQRLNIFRKKFPPRNLEHKNVIIIDDGLATGYTMKAAIETVRAEKALNIIVAVPVAPVQAIEEIEKLVDKVICLEIPLYFEAVGQFYENFQQIEDEEVIRILEEINLTPDHS